MPEMAKSQFYNCHTTATPLWCKDDEEDCLQCLDGSAHPISNNNIICERLPHDARRAEASASVSETPTASPDASRRASWARPRFLRIPLGRPRFTHPREDVGAPAPEHALSGSLQARHLLFCTASGLPLSHRYSQWRSNGTQMGLEAMRDAAPTRAVGCKDNYPAPIRKLTRGTLDSTALPYLPPLQPQQRLM
ncbi:hypothetical protein B0H14DRAFT_3535120 [Mycena olivaceomarginata]|nr:hypothetical protein B0H14DRAFT_3535120 [Mycena olivaceomarginata]